MAITHQDLIRDALTLAGIIAKDQPVSARQAQDALDLLNEMMAEWDEAVTRKLGWYEITDLTANVPIPRWAQRGVKGSLARALAADYQLPVTQEVLSMQTAGLSAIRKRTVGAREVDFTFLPQGQCKISPSGQKAWD